MKLNGCMIGILCVMTGVVLGGAQVTFERSDAPWTMAFEKVAGPVRGDAAEKATFKVIEGRRDGNGADVRVLNDGRTPTGQDQPGANFFFAAGTDGGRILVDLGEAIAVEQVNTYSWHPNTRGPQVYTLYAATGEEEGIAMEPRGGTDPATAGWTRIAAVDTRPERGQGGGQYGANVRAEEGTLGTWRYLLLDISATETSDPFGNTFFSEIDVVSPGAKTDPAIAGLGEPGQSRRQVVEMDGGYRIVIDTTETPDLTEWAEKELAPVVGQWYPKLVAMLPSEGYEAPRQAAIVFSADMRGVAATGGTNVRCAANWFRGQLQGEAKGAVVHELVHVVQQYGWARRVNSNPSRTPGWLVEGICDYIRWFLYEPQTRGAEIGRRGLARARYDGSYRVTGNFLNWVVGKHGERVIRELNAAAREGRYDEAMWKELTGSTVQELNDQWKQDLEAAIAAAEAEAARANKLTDEEKAAGWKLLFNGQDTEGWHTFRRDDVRPGWQVRDGALVCADPHNAGDLCTDGKYGWFELQLDYNISHGGNSGIMYHVTDEAGAAWATGPEFQLEDNAAAADPVRCGWLYALYQPPTDPKTGKPLDATKPAGEWNHVRLVIGPDKCVHEINGVKYFEYVLGSEEFRQRVQQSKFRRMPGFAKAGEGRIALQGDHGQVSFRNIKIRPIEAAK